MEHGLKYIEVSFLIKLSGSGRTKNKKIYKKDTETRTETAAGDNRDKFYIYPFANAYVACQMKIYSLAYTYI